LFRPLSHCSQSDETGKKFELPASLYWQTSSFTNPIEAPSNDIGEISPSILPIFGRKMIRPQEKKTIDKVILLRKSWVFPRKFTTLCSNDLE